MRETEEGQAGQGTAVTPQDGNTNVNGDLSDLTVPTSSSTRYCTVRETPNKLQPALKGIGKAEDFCFKRGDVTDPTSTSTKM